VLLVPRVMPFSNAHPNARVYSALISTSLKFALVAALGWPCFHRNSTAIARVQGVYGAKLLPLTMLFSYAHSAGL